MRRCSGTGAGNWGGGVGDTPWDQYRDLSGGGGAGRCPAADGGKKEMPWGRYGDLGGYVRALGQV